jgi:membrane protein implicated in regulation of membrane protease activity
MRNPLENEETAFRFVLGTIAYLAPIVIASWIATWLGVIVFVVASGVVVVLIRRGTRSPPPEPPSGQAQVEDTPAGPGDDRR